jgi:hypothetical protein
MNRDLLPKNELEAGFRVFKPKDLLERFLDTVKTEAQEAARTKQPLLLLVFALGEERTSGLFISCTTPITSTPRSNTSPLPPHPFLTFPHYEASGDLILTQARFASVLQKEVQTTMISTLSNSGG